MNSDTHCLSETFSGYPPHALRSLPGWDYACFPYHYRGPLNLQVYEWRKERLPERPQPTSARLLLPPPPPAY